MDVKQAILSLAFLLTAALAHAQLTLDECRRQAQANYPLVRRYGLIEKACEYDLSNAGKGYLPRFSLSGKATYQSDITRLPVEMPGIDVETAPKDQYQVMLELQQTIWDGGDIRNRKRLTRAASDVDMEKQHVDMYALNDRINQLFFGILLLDEQLKQNRLLQDDLGRTHKQVSDYMANGIATQSDLDAVSVEQLNTEARRAWLAFATSPQATWRGNFRELSASVTRMATFATSGRITLDVVEDEINRLRYNWQESRPSALTALLGAEAENIDLFDRLQLEHVIALCRQAKSLSAAGRLLFDVSRQGKASVNDADRLRKYLARFGLTWEAVQDQHSSS